MSINNTLHRGIAAMLYKVIFEQVAKSQDIAAGPYKLKAPRTEWDTANPMGSYSTTDPNGKVLGVLDSAKGGEGQPSSITSYIDKLQNSDGTQEKSQNLFQR